jgi:flagellar motor switch protein FliM
MNKILSQAEIEALLTTVTKGLGASGAGSERRSIQLYDFKHPERVSKEQVRTLRTIHDNFARLFATHLSTSLRTLVDVNLLSLDQVTFNEYAMSLTVPSALFTLKLQAIHGKAIIEISPQFLLFVVDRLLGGFGETNLGAREITLVEQSVVQKMIGTIVNLLNDAWNQVNPLGAVYESYESDPQFVQIARGSESLAIIFFEIRVRGAIYTMNFGIPYLVLEPILNRLSAQSMMAMASKKDVESTGTVIQDRILASKLPVRVLLAETTVSVRDFIELQPDDVVQFEKKTTEPLPIQVGERIKYMGSPGQLGKRRAVQVLRPIGQDEEIIYE